MISSLQNKADQIKTLKLAACADQGNLRWGSPLHSGAMLIALKLAKTKALGLKGVYEKPDSSGGIRCFVEEIFQIV